MQWQLQDAKNRLSAVVKKAADEYNRLTKPQTSLADFFKNSPLYDTDLEIERSKESAREVEL